MAEISWQKFIQKRKTLPILDVRSPSEYQRGHIPGASSLPLLSDDDRKTIGKTYTQRGKIEAVKTGFQRIGPRIDKIIAAVEKCAQKKTIITYCWRGGMRSSYFSQFMEMADFTSYHLKGGYKTYRKKALELFQYPFKIMLLSGYTGTGKTELLREIGKQGEQIIDLEHIANHKGSVFGGLDRPPQPTTEQFQNLLFEKLLTFDPSKIIWIENESMTIGRVFIPNDFWLTMKKSPMLRCDLKKSIRIERLVREYGNISKEKFYTAMTKITKRLGPQRFKRATEKLAQNDMYAVIEILLTYYDKTYLHTLEQHQPESYLTFKWNGENSALAGADLIHTAHRLH